MVNRQIVINKVNQIRNNQSQTSVNCVILGFNFNGVRYIGV